MSIVLETLIRHFEREPNAVMWPNGIALRHGEIAAVLRHHALPVADRIRELEARVDDEQKYVVTLHRMIEAHCRGERVSNSDSPHIAAMLNANLSEAASEPVAWALMRGDVPVDGFLPTFALPTDAFELQRVFRAEFVALYTRPTTPTRGRDE